MQRRRRIDSGTSVIAGDGTLALADERALGSPIAFIVAVVIVVVWALTGPVFGFSETWQLVIDTGTTIITFLMVFVIQNTQNRDIRAQQLKLDELLRAEHVERAVAAIHQVLRSRQRPEAQPEPDDSEEP